MRRNLPAWAFKVAQNGASQNTHCFALQRRANILKQNRDFSDDTPPQARYHWQVLLLCSPSELRPDLVASHRCQGRQLQLNMSSNPPQQVCCLCVARSAIHQAGYPVLRSVKVTEHCSTQAQALEASFLLPRPVSPRPSRSSQLLQGLLKVCLLVLLTLCISPYVTIFWHYLAGRPAQQGMRLTKRWVCFPQLSSRGSTDTDAWISLVVA